MHFDNQWMSMHLEFLFLRDLATIEELSSYTWSYYQNQRSDVENQQRRN